MVVPFSVDYLQHFWRLLRDALWESECLGCGRPQDRLCTSCVSRLPRALPSCIGCSRTNRDGRTCIRCTHTWPVHTLIAAHPYTNSVVTSSIRSFKYRLEYRLAHSFAKSMTAALREQTPIQPLVIPVPLHKNRKRWRGFDQAAILAKAIACTTLFSYAEPLLRVRNTPQQAKAPNRVQRLEAMQDAFRVVQPELVTDRNVILVDDVCTTGSTIGACASALHQVGVQSVTALVYARK